MKRCEAQGLEKLSERAFAAPVRSYRAVLVSNHLSETPAGDGLSGLRHFIAHELRDAFQTVTRSRWGLLRAADTIGEFVACRIRDHAEFPVDQQRFELQ